MNNRPGECQRCMCEVQEGQVLCGYCECDDRNAKRRSMAEIDGRLIDMGWKRKPTLFESGLAFLFLFLGWLWECAAKMFRGKA